jgi:hypothetical protein
MMEVRKMGLLNVQMIPRIRVGKGITKARMGMRGRARVEGGAWRGLICSFEDGGDAWKEMDGGWEVGSKWSTRVFSNTLLPHRTNKTLHEAQFLRLWICK